MRPTKTTQKEKVQFLLDNLPEIATSKNVLMDIDLIDRAEKLLVENGFYHTRNYDARKDSVGKLLLKAKGEKRFINHVVTFSKVAR